MEKVLENSENLSLGERANALPGLPGVYIMMDKSGEVIYVGKALSLRNRVSSYFHGEHNAKTELMVSKIDHFDVIVVGNEFEALVLENRLIKHHMPKYNIKLRDDKGHPFIKTDLTKPYPRFEIVGKNNGDGLKYLGPYSGRSAAFKAIDTVSRAMGLPTCSRVFPRDIGKERACISKDIGVCKGWCEASVENTSESDYRKCIDDAIEIFEGRAKTLIAPLTEEMQKAAEDLQFELAAALRDRVRALGEIAKKQIVVSSSSADTDAIGFYKGAAKSCFVVMHYIGGVLLGKESELFETPIEEDIDALSSLITQYYSRRGTAPDSVLVNDLPEDAESIEKVLQDISRHNVRLEKPTRGDRAKLVKYAGLNAREETDLNSTREEKTTKTIEWLKHACGLETLPVRMESYDISNTGDTGIAASMVVFENGKPKRSAYRKFEIKTTDGQDDLGSMEEVITRRAERYLAGDAKFMPLPDIFLIDGGKNHAVRAEKTLRERGIETPVFGMVKDNKHKTRALIGTDGREIGIDAHPAAFALIGTIQEETHRFALGYHTTLRSKKMKASELDSILGIGEQRRRDLLKAFGSLAAISKAGIAELVKVVPANAAVAIIDYFKKKDKEDD